MKRRIKMKKISAVYKIVNTITGDFYVGSSNDVKRRWTQHKLLSVWKQQPNNLLYKDFQKFGLENFRFQILAPVMPECLKQVEQEFIEMLRPSYNKINSNGRNVEARKNVKKKYDQSKKGKCINQKARNKYNNQPCSYNGRILTLSTLAARFQRAGIKHATLEAKKYLLAQQ